MKKLIALPFVYILYWIGCFFGWLAFKFPDMLWLFLLYQNFMLWSIELQDWAELKGPWKLGDRIDRSTRSVNSGSSWRRASTLSLSSLKFTIQTIYNKL